MTDEIFDYQYQESYPGYLETSASKENTAVREYFSYRSISSPRFFVLENPNPPHPGRMNFVRKLIGAVKGAKTAPYLDQFSGDNEFFGKYDEKRNAFFLRKDSPYVKKHELSHFYTDQDFPNLIKVVAGGYKEQKPSDKPFVYNFIYEGIAELVAVDDGLTKTGEELEEAQKWENFRLTGQKVAGKISIDHRYLQSQLEKASVVIERYKTEAINPESLLRRDQYHKAQDALKAEPNSGQSSVEYSLGYAYCLAHFRKLIAEGKSKKDALREILQSPPQDLAQIKDALEILAA